jgi:hypothetical protein
VEEKEKLEVHQLQELNVDKLILEVEEAEFGVVQTDLADRESLY